MRTINQKIDNFIYEEHFIFRLRCHTRHYLHLHVNLNKLLKLKNTVNIYNRFDYWRLSFVNIIGDIS